MGGKEIFEITDVPLNNPTKVHVERFHAYGPAVQKGLQEMVKAGEAPADVLKGPKEYHIWSHSNGAGGSPSHTHPFR